MSALDEYRKEYNEMLLKKALGANSIIQEKFLTISVNGLNNTLLHIVLTVKVNLILFEFFLS